MSNAQVAGAVDAAVPLFFALVGGLNMALPKALLLDPYVCWPLRLVNRLPFLRMLAMLGRPNSSSSWSKSNWSESAVVQASLASLRFVYVRLIGGLASDADFGGGVLLFRVIEGGVRGRLSPVKDLIAVRMAGPLEKVRVVLQSIQFQHVCM